MGYYTQYRLNYWAKENCMITPEMDQAIRDFFNRTVLVDEGFEEITEYGVEWKWDGHEEDMKRMAREFPDVVFELEGEGEDRDDWWIKEFCGDQYAESYAEVIPPHNPIFQSS